METKNNTLVEKLCKIQGELKAPKGQTNNFGHYKYRSCEDILEAVKPLLVKQELLLTLTDKIVLKGSCEDTHQVRYYVQAIATITDGITEMKVSAFARESLDKKGMDSAQITGATSSYARKYALNGMFLIDDTKDADTMDNSKVEVPAVNPASKITTKDQYNRLTASSKTKVGEYYGELQGVPFVEEKELLKDILK